VLVIGVKNVKPILLVRDKISKVSSNPKLLSVSQKAEAPDTKVPHATGNTFLFKV